MAKDNNDVVYIKLDRERQLWCGHKALKQMTALMGKELSQIDTGSGMDFGDIEKIYFCMLQKDAREHGEDLSLDGMEDLLDLVPYQVITAKLEEAFVASFGKAAESPKNE